MTPARCSIIEVTRDRPDLIAGCFPEARDAGVPPHLYAAVGPAGEVLALGLLASPSWREAPAFRCMFDVPPAMAGRGMDVAMLHHFIALARQHRAPALRNGRPARNDEECALYEQHGFVCLRRTLTHRFSLGTALDVFKAEMDRLRAAGKVRADLRVQPYAEGPQRDISTLCQAEFGMLTQGHLRAIGEYPAPDDDSRHARSLWHRGTLVAAWGVSVRGGIATFDPLLVARRWRNTCAFPLIVHTVLEALVADGVRWGHAAIHEDNRKVMALMPRVEATVIATEVLYELPLAPGASAP